MMSVQIQLRRGTAAQWTSANTLLAQGEIGLEYDTGKIKVGDGTLAWNSLAYFTGTGAVTSVTGTSPVVSSGGTTPAISLASGYGDTQNPYASKTANNFLAAPNGTAGAPTFRAVVAADIPTLNQNTTGTAANVTGTVAIANGGTGQTTAAAAITALSGTQTSGHYLRSDGTNTALAAIVAGDVPTLNQNTTGTAANVTGIVAVANGGTGLSSGTSGGVPYYSATGTIASSAALAASALVVGGGAGVAPATTATGTGVVTALGVNVGSAGAVVVNGGALGTPSGGTATNLTGLPLTTGVTGILPVANGGTGAALTTSNFVFAGPASGSPAAPSFRALTTADIAGLSSGSVTSVALALPSIMTVSGSPVTSTGTLTGTLTTQAINAIFAGPSSGAAAAPTFRSLTTADIPTLNQNTTGTASNVTGIVAVVNGGSGTATPSLVAGTNVTVTGTWPNQTIAASGGGGGGSSAGSNIFLANNFGGF